MYVCIDILVHCFVCVLCIEPADKERAKIEKTDYNFRKERTAFTYRATTSNTTVGIYSVTLTRNRKKS